MRKARCHTTAGTVKVRSYEVEAAFYTHFAHRCDPALCRVPRCIDATASPEIVIRLEDLDAAGFPGRGRQDVDGCVRWLAAFHAAFMGIPDPGGLLWERGLYWYLATRPDELAALPDKSRLKQSAMAIDHRLDACRFKTLVHGDAKVANFCFGKKVGDPVAACDFQYVGSGVGVCDVAYFMTNVVRDNAPVSDVMAILAMYFQHLRSHMCLFDTVDLIEAEWRDAFPFAVADFYRFYCGWGLLSEKRLPAWVDHFVRIAVSQLPPATC